MTKWKCSKPIRMCSYPCYVELANDSLIPRNCLFGDTRTPKWERVPDEPEQKLPKLTADVFDRPDCPAWAEYAAIAPDGVIVYFRERPELDIMPALESQCVGETLIERPEKNPKRPDWMEYEKWFYFRGNYVKLFFVNEDQNMVSLSFLSGNRSVYSPKEVYMEAVEARLRPWTKEDAIGKVVKNDCCVGIITYADKFKCIVGTKVLTLKKLAKEYHEPNGKPCGVLEHMENGEWKE